MAVWHKSDSVKEASAQRQEKEMLARSMEQAITDLELASIRQEQALANLETAMQEIQKAGTP